MKQIGVLPTRNQPGANALTDRVPALEVMPYREVFETPFSTDAHFALYEPVGNFHQKTWPRLNKPVLDRMRAHDADLAFGMLILDYDNPGHVPWAGPESVDSFLRVLRRTAHSAEFPLADQWSCLYTTKHGARLVYLLDYDIGPEEYEQRHQWLCQQFSKRGIEIDCSVSDWTRIFRAPFVVRNGEESWELNSFRMIQQWDRTLDPEELGKATRGDIESKYADVQPLEGQKPEDLCRASLLFEISSHSGKQIRSHWYKEAKKRLVNRDCSKVLFNEQIIGKPGERDTNLHKHVGQAISLLYYLEDTTPEHIYALFLEPVQRLEPDEGTPDWTDSLWDHICRLWAKEDAKARQKQEDEKQKQQGVESKVARIVRGVRDWASDPEAFDDSKAGVFITRRMLANYGRSYYPMKPDGTYSSEPILKDQIIPWIRSNDMEDLIPTQRLNKDGDPAGDIDTVNIVNKHSYPVKEVQGKPEIAGGYLTEDSKLVIPLYRRNPNLLPEYNKDVETWLMMLFGEKFDLACKWIAYSLAFEEGPICGLSIMGHQGGGKKMLVEGLSECLENPYLAGADDIVSDYQYGLLRSPFLVVNEGWPTQKSRHPADTFRNLVGGDGLQANIKYHAPIRTKNPARIIFAANNIDVVGFLTGGRDLSPEDREALQIRLLHFDVGDDASLWLRARGGVRFTGGWIAGDGGRPSNFVVAKHFLYLHQIRARFGPPEPRLLVEGRDNSDLMFSMRTQSGRGPLVVESLIKLLNMPREREGLTIEEGKLFILSSEILDFFRKEMASSTKESLTARIISGVLKGLVEESHENALQLESRKNLGRKRWHQIDPEMLLKAAERDGWKCTKLERLVKERRKLGMGTQPEERETIK